MTFTGASLAPALSKEACPALESILNRAMQMGIQAPEGSLMAGIGGLSSLSASRPASQLAVESGLLPSSMALTAPDAAALRAMVARPGAPAYNGRRLSQAEGDAPGEQPAVHPSWEQVPACTQKPEGPTSVVDDLNRLWGFENGESCAWRDEEAVLEAGKSSPAVAASKPGVLLTSAPAAVAASAPPPAPAPAAAVAAQPPTAAVTAPAAKPAPAAAPQPPAPSLATAQPVAVPAVPQHGAAAAAAAPALATAPAAKLAVPAAASAAPVAAVAKPVSSRQWLWIRWHVLRQCTVA